MSELLWAPGGQSSSDKKLALRWWKNRYKSQVPPRGFLFIFHGMGEHGGRYDEMAQFFSHWGFDVIAPDFPGHGLTAGEGEWPELEGARKCSAVVEHLIHFWYSSGPRSRSQIKGCPYYCFGHSYGGLILLNWAHTLRDRKSVNPLPEKIAVASAPLRIKVPVPAFKKAFARFASRAAPYFKISAGLDPVLVSADPVIQHHYEMDPLNHPYVSPEMFYDMLELSPQILDGAMNLELPILVLAAEKDGIADAEGLKDYYAKLGTQKRLLIFKNSEHEIHNDRERRAMFEELLQWMI